MSSIIGYGGFTSNVIAPIFIIDLTLLSKTIFSLPMEDTLQPRFKTIIGLGNPGPKYEATWHNLGFIVLDTLAGGKKFKAGKGNYYSCDIELSSANVVLLKPTTYMNRSGLAVADFAGENNISPGELLVIADDFNLPMGQLRLRKSGSDGGHNGLASIIYHLGSDAFPRLRLGIGPVPDGMAAEEFVLMPFGRDQEKAASEMVARAADAVIEWLEHGFEYAASRFNRALE